MIKSVTVTNYLGNSITLELSNPEPSGFIVESIDGLGSGIATINTTEISTTDGALYNSARVPCRNIVLHLLYMWNATIEDARQLSYKYFPLKRRVTLSIKTDNRLCEIDGYVESNEPNIFSEVEGTDISIVCPYPFFRSGYGNQSTLFSGVIPLFEFPFENDSLTENLLEMGEIVFQTENIVTYEGDVETGIIIRIHALDDVGDIGIYNLDTRQIMQLRANRIAAIIGSPIEAGDDIIICTIQGQKSVSIVRDGVTTNLLNCLDKNTDWFHLVKGDNRFVYTASYGMEDLTFEIENPIIYEGV